MSFLHQLLHQNNIDASSKLHNKHG